GFCRVYSSLPAEHAAKVSEIMRRRGQGFAVKPEDDSEAGAFMNLIRQNAPVRTVSGKLQGFSRLLVKALVPVCGDVVSKDSMCWQHRKQIQNMVLCTEIDTGGRFQARMQQWFYDINTNAGIAAASLTAFLGLGDTSLDLVVLGDGGKAS